LPRMEAVEGVRRPAHAMSLFLPRH
jgi:hypothetical protein